MDFNFYYVLLIFSVDTHGLLFLKDEKGITITNAFQKILKEYNCKPNKIWIDRGSEFYNRLIKSCLEKNETEIYSTLNEEKSVAAKIY